MPTTVLTPRPLPERRLPVIAGGAVVALVGAVAVVATFYIVIVLEILKLTRVRAWAGRRREAKDEQSKAISA